MNNVPGLLLAAALLALIRCGNEREQAAVALTGGDPGRGREAIRQHGCAACHTIPGIRDADALVGPPLDRIASRTYIAGVLLNTPSNMTKWLRDPPAVDPLTAMPNVRLSDADVKDVAAYLYTLK